MVREAGIDIDAKEVQELEVAIFMISLGCGGLRNDVRR